MSHPVMLVQAHMESVLGGSGARDALAQRVRALFHAQPSAEVENLCGQVSEFAENYVRSTVWMLEQCDQAAAGAGLAQDVGPVLLQAAGYFLNPADYLPDHYGLLGLLDDAYLCCRFMAELNTLYRSDTGVDLLDVSLDQSSSPTVRNLIGPPVVAQLDTDVQHGIRQVLQLVNLARVQPLRYHSQAHWNQWVEGENAINVEAQISSVVTGGY